MKKIKLKIDNSYFILLFFCFYLTTGILVVGDYSVTPDEPLHRTNGFISLKYISDFFGLNINLSDHFKKIPDLHNDWRKTYGVIFDLPLAFLEVVFNLDNKSDIFLLRHFFTFFTFFVSSVFFYFLIHDNLRSKALAFIGVLILITSPRMFSHSFYNSKDIIFLSLMIIAVYYSLKTLKNFGYKNLFLSCLFCALATNIRIIGLYLPLLIFFFYYFKEKKNNEINTYYFFTLYFSIYFIILYLIWPFLWNNPIGNFFFVLSESMNYPSWWDFKTFYLGQYLDPENLPWHYFFIWFGVTTPPIFLLLILFGIMYFIKEYFSYFLKIKLNSDIFLWKNENGMIDLFFFLLFFTPLFFVICLNSTMYNGWRHLYFLYPFFILLSLSFLCRLKEKKYIRLFKIFLLIIFFQCFSNIFFIYKSHPVQNVYFNSVFKKYVKGKLPVDYWGVGNKKTIDNLLSKKQNLKISVASYTNLFNIELFTKNAKRPYSENLKVFGTSKNSKNITNYIFTNYYYDRDPKNEESYRVPKEFQSYYKLIIDDILVNEVFKK